MGQKRLYLSISQQKYCVNILNCGFDFHLIKDNITD